MSAQWQETAGIQRLCTYLWLRRGHGKFKCLQHGCEQNLGLYHSKVLGKGGEGGEGGACTIRQDETNTQQLVS